MHNDYLLGMTCWRKPDTLFLPFNNIEDSKRDILVHIFELIILVLVKLDTVIISTLNAI